MMFLEIVIVENEISFIDDLRTLSTPERNVSLLSARDSVARDTKLKNK